MDINIWTQRYFNENSKFKWHCPNCNSQSLEIVKEKFSAEETRSSADARSKDEFYETEWIELNVIGQLKCKSCREFVSFIGEGNPEEFGYYNAKTDEYEMEYLTNFTPKYLQPTIKIFEIPQNCPELVRLEIEDSFRIYWTDLDSCANKLRLSLEVLMDEFKIKRYKNVGGKRQPISLHKRIEELKNSEVKEILLAIKWIGNSGSHSNQKLETIDVLEIYRLLEFSLQKLFNDNEKEIKSIAKEINQRKGVRKRKK